MALTRKLHWATRDFHRFLIDNAEKPFIWGLRDCCLFAADAVESITGVDLAADFRGQYKDQESAFAAIKKITGGSTVEDAAVYCAVKHGLKELSGPLYAQRGDLVLVADNGNTVAGVIHLNGRHAVVVGETGLKRVSIRSVKRAWRV